MKGIYQKVHPLRRKLISAWMLSDEEYVKKWQSVEYVGKPFEDNSQEIITEKGERVRLIQECWMDLLKSCFV